jgi:hypothetical protein
MTSQEVKHLQTEMNSFIRKHKGLGYSLLIVDGDLGELTKRRIRAIKYLIGYMRENQDTTVNDNFYHRMRHPNDTKNNWGQTKETVKRGRRRRVRRRRWVAQNRVKSYVKPGVGRFDGRPVAKCAIPLLKWARDNGWRGRLNSGWRDPKYSQSLCYAMCGRPSCPGKCAGMSSNHVGNSPSRFAMDVSDYVRFGQLMRQCPLKPKVHNSLGVRDPVHYSPSGS